MRTELKAYWAQKSPKLIEMLRRDFRERKPYLPIEANGCGVYRAIQIIEESKPDLLLADQRLTDFQLKYCDVLLTSREDGLFRHELKWYSRIPDFPPDLAYILYTSGSTGIPKGVLLTRANADSFIQWASDTFPMSPADIVASIAPLHFDLSVFDLHVTSRMGAQLWVPPAEAVSNPRLMVQAMVQAGVTVIYATPTFFQFLLNHGKLDRYDFSKIRLILFAGEPFPSVALRSLMDRFPCASFHNLYGPTETNVVSHWKVPSDFNSSDQCLIGSAASKAKLCVDYSGELLVKGPSVSPGYVHEMSATKIVRKFQWYRTGDLVSKVEPGIYQYLGRKDRMVKRRGYRIEPQEIEHVMFRTGLFSNVYCLVEKGPRLVLVYSSSDGELPIDRLVNSARMQLPIWMLPDAYFYVPKWPMSSSGKVDVNALRTKWMHR